MQFKINLIKNKVLAPDKRRKVFLAIIAYLFACVLAFAFLSLRAFGSLVGVNEFQREVLSLEERFQGASSTRKNISQYNEQMKEEIKEYLGKLKAIESVLSKNIDPNQILMRISKTLPKGSYIDDFNLDNDKKTLNFNIVSPIGKKGESVNISGLIAAWKKDSILMAAIKNITSSQSERQQKRNTQALVSKFSCILAKGEVN